MSKKTNEQKYKTAEERVKAFDAWCRKEEQCRKCGLDTSRACAYCFNRWLSLEAEEKPEDEEEKPLPCPFCDGEVEAQALGGEKDKSGNVYLSLVRCKHCGYESRSSSELDSIGAIIAEHNRVARAVRAAGENNN